MSVRERSRGYALPMVLLVLMLLAVAFAGLVRAVTGVTASTAAAMRARESRLQCEGLARVTGSALNALVVAGTTSREDIDLTLNQIRRGAAVDGIRQLRVEASLRDTSVLNTVGSGAFSGLPYLEQLISIRLRTKDDNDACKALAEQPVASFALTQFSSVSGPIPNTFESSFVARCDLPDGSSTTSVTPPVGSFLPVPLPTAVAYSTEPAFLGLTAGARCPDVRYTSGQPASGYGVTNADALTLSLPFQPQSTTSNPFALRVDSLSAAGATPQKIVETQEKLPMLKADLRIMNGTWYKKRLELSLDWPGTQIWSDGFDQSTINAGGPRLYSWYERSNGDAALGEPAGSMLLNNTGVVSYGAPVHGEALTRQELCVVPTARPCVLRPHVAVGLDGGDTERVVARATRINMTRLGFNAPGVQASNNPSTDSDTATSRVTPINIDVGFLVTAFNLDGQGELGSHFCLANGCRGRQFNGILYISNTTTEYSSAERIARVPPPVGNNRPGGSGPKNHVLSPLFAPSTFWSGISSLEYGGTSLFRSAPPAGVREHTGSAMGITDAATFRTGPGVAPEGNGGYGYSAVRLTNASNLTAFNDTGFTLISAVPVFIEGDFNTALQGGRRAAALIMAPAVFVSTPGVEAFYPLVSVSSSSDPLGTHQPGIPADPRFVVHASLLVAVSQSPQGAHPSYAAARHLPVRTGAANATILGAGELVRSLNPGATIEVHGSISSLPTAMRFSTHDLTKPGGVKVEQRYPLALTTATTRTATDQRLPPGTPRAAFVLNTITLTP